MKQLEVKNLEFTGRVNVVEYMRKLDFTVLTSISEEMCIRDRVRTLETRWQWPRSSVG